MTNKAQARTQRYVLNAVIAVLGTVTIGGALFFAAVDRPLLTAAIGIVGAVPLAALAIAVGRVDPPADERDRLSRQTRTAVTLAIIGAVMTATGIPLLWTTYTTLATILLFTGPGFAGGGLMARAMLRHGGPPREQHPYSER